MRYGTSLLLFVLAASSLPVSANPVMLPSPTPAPHTAPVTVDPAKSSLLILEYDLQNPSNDERSAAQRWIATFENELTIHNIDFVEAATDADVQNDCQHVPSSYQAAYVLHYHFHSDHSGPTFLGFYPAIGQLYVRLLSCKNEAVFPLSLSSTITKRRMPWQIPITTDTALISTTNIVKPGYISGQASAYVGAVTVAFNTLIQQHPDIDGEQNALGAAFKAYADLLQSQGIHH